jgi:hypothetical protein
LLLHPHLDKTAAMIGRDAVGLQEYRFLV